MSEEEKRPPTKVYTVAHKTTECYGHGSYGTEQRICRMGPWGGGSFPPIFRSHKQAEEYLQGVEYKFGLVVVELELVTDERV